MLKKNHVGQKARLEEQAKRVRFEQDERRKVERFHAERQRQHNVDMKAAQDKFTREVLTNLTPPSDLRVLREELKEEAAARFRVSE